LWGEASAAELLRFKIGLDGLEQPGLSVPETAPSGSWAEQEKESLLSAKGFHRL